MFGFLVFVWTEPSTCKACVLHPQPWQSFRFFHGLLFCFGGRGCYTIKVLRNQLALDRKKTLDSCLWSMHCSQFCWVISSAPIITFVIKKGRKHVCLRQGSRASRQILVYQEKFSPTYIKFICMIYRAMSLEKENEQYLDTKIAHFFSSKEWKNLDVNDKPIIGQNVFLETQVYSNTIF